MQVNIDNLSIKYDDCGEGSPVLLLHGWGASLETMRPVSDAIVKLGMRAVSLDFPGFGGSEAPRRFGALRSMRALYEGSCIRLTLKVQMFCATLSAAAL